MGATEPRVGATHCSSDLAFFQYLRQENYLSHSGIEGYRSALKGLYRDQLGCNDGWNQERDPPGNPIDNPLVSDFMKSVKKEDARTTEVPMIKACLLEEVYMTVFLIIRETIGWISCASWVPIRSLFVLSLVRSLDGLCWQSRSRVQHISASTRSKRR